MRILALVPSPKDTTPGQRYRLEQWEPFLRTYGVEIVFQPFKCLELHDLLCKPGNQWRKAKLIFDGLSRRARLLRSVRDYDLIYIYSEAALLGPAVFERLIRWADVPIVFDFDDAIFLPYTYVSPANGYLRLLKFPTKTRAICRLASHVIVGNSYLADYARRVSESVTVIPSTINTDQYTPVEKGPTPDPPVIGWTGSYSTLQYLDMLRGTLRKLAQRERFKLRVIGPADYRIEGVNVEAVPWDPRTEVEDLRPVDVGIMPMRDDHWTRGKCGMKALQYMGLGLPVVCSPVGANRTIVKDGYNGFLAGGEDEWIDRLTRLLRSASLRRQMGKAARETVAAEYSAAVQVPHVYKVLRSVVTGTVPERLTANKQTIT